MIKAEVHKAGMIGEETLVESVTIFIVQEIPSIKTLDEANQIFGGDAELIVNTLCTVLPQGTVDRVLAKLMMRKAKSLVIPMEK